VTSLLRFVDKRDLEACSALVLQLPFNNNNTPLTQHPTRIVQTGSLHMSTITIDTPPAQPSQSEHHSQADAPGLATAFEAWNNEQISRRCLEDAHYDAGMAHLTAAHAHVQMVRIASMHARAGRAQMAAAFTHVDAAMAHRRAAEVSASSGTALEVESLVRTCEAEVKKMEARRRVAFDQEFFSRTHKSSRKQRKAILVAVLIALLLITLIIYMISA
jgi:hypothetical protein